MILVDTDHATFLKYPESDHGRRFIERLAAVPQSEVVGMAIVTVEERMRSWLAVIAREKTALRQVVGYRELARLFEFYQAFEIVAFDEAVAHRFDDLRTQRLRLGTMDLKIAATALVNKALLLSANRRDFERVPGLRVENWLDDRALRRRRLLRARDRRVGVPMPPLVLINAVGLTPRLLAHAPRYQALLKSGWLCRLREPLPAVTCTAQATLLTGQTPEQHGVVANGWYWRDLGEVRFWLQSNAQLLAEPLYATARRRAAARQRPFRCAKLFWWFNQGAAVDFSVTPKPHYGADGRKAFGVHGSPLDLPARLERLHGPFPFPNFWGPMAGMPCTQWIAQAAATLLREGRPDLSLVYLPHLDYDPQRHGPDGCDLPALVRQLDDATAPLFDAAQQAGARVWVVSEYGHVPVRQPVLLNRVLRLAGLLTVRPGPFGETLDTFESTAFAVCDHQLAHVYVRDAAALPRVRAVLAQTPGVARVVGGEERHELDLLHARSGDLIVLSQPEAWFAYPFWLDDRQAPDYARTVDIHRKPGYDPCELFFDPRLWWPKGRVLGRLAQKMLGFRILMDVVPLDAGLVRGSHGLRADRPDDRPLLLGDGPQPSAEELPMTAVRDLVLAALDLPS